MNEELPIEIQDWLQDMEAHRTAAERIAAFYLRLQSTILNVEAAISLTGTWMMICYGMPKNMPPLPPRGETKE